MEKGEKKGEKKGEVSMKRLFCSVVLVVAFFFGVASPVRAAPGKSKKAVKQKKQILIYAHRERNGIEYVYGGQQYSGRELDYLLGEWHVEASRDSEVVVVLEDNLALST